MLSKCAGCMCVCIGFLQSPQANAGIISSRDTQKPLTVSVNISLMNCICCLDCFYYCLMYILSSHMQSLYCTIWVYYWKSLQHYFILLDVSTLYIY